MIFRVYKGRGLSTRSEDRLPIKLIRNILMTWKLMVVVSPVQSNVTYTIYWPIIWISTYANKLHKYKRTGRYLLVIDPFRDEYTFVVRRKMSNSILMSVCYYFGGYVQGACVDRQACPTIISGERGQVTTTSKLQLKIQPLITNTYT